MLRDCKLIFDVSNAIYISIFLLLFENKREKNKKKKRRKKKRREIEKLQTRWLA